MIIVSLLHMKPSIHHGLEFTTASIISQTLYHTNIQLAYTPTDISTCKSSHSCSLRAQPSISYI